QADYGFIVATCENDKPIRPLDLRKKIYISGDNNNLFVVAKIMRELIITKHNFKENSSVKERKIKNLDEWINDKLPRYVSSLEEEFVGQEKEANHIISKAEKIKNSTEKIRKLTLDKIILEIRSI
ncbi:32149_t:CDS:1, partial [Racocetra persica]